mmetsp:Transcript_64984/g.89283  ORF Transcript_64984/g.89283 Transcript_64984/m.89283 type:complete len:310 (+) Transcript_64984:694-1623(+)
MRGAKTSSSCPGSSFVPEPPFTTFCRVSVCPLTLLYIDRPSRRIFSWSMSDARLSCGVNVSSRFSSSSMICFRWSRRSFVSSPYCMISSTVRSVGLFACFRYRRLSFAPRRLGLSNTSSTSSLDCLARFSSSFFSLTWRSCSIRWSIGPRCVSFDIRAEFLLRLGLNLSSRSCSASSRFCCCLIVDSFDRLVPCNLSTSPFHSLLRITFGAFTDLVVSCLLAHTSYGVGRFGSSTLVSIRYSKPDSPSLHSDSSLDSTSRSSICCASMSIICWVEAPPSVNVTDWVSSARLRRAIMSSSSIVAAIKPVS